MNGEPTAPHAPHGAPPTALHDGSLHLIAGIAIGVAVGGALVGAMLYWMRPQQPKSWHGRVRDELAEQLKQLQKAAAAVAHEMERG